MIFQAATNYDKRGFVINASIFIFYSVRPHINFGRNSPGRRTVNIH